MRTGIPAAAAVAVAVVVTGCTTASAPRPSTATTAAGITVVREGGRVLLTHPGSDGDQALLRGALGENAAHCVTVHGEVVIWPAGTTLLRDGSVVVRGTTLRVGTTVGIGGGVWPPGLAVPGGCSTGAGARYWDGGSVD